jgi:hypothetical protein
MLDDVKIQEQWLSGSFTNVMTYNKDQITDGEILSVLSVFCNTYHVPLNYEYDINEGILTVRNIYPRRIHEIRVEYITKKDYRNRQLEKILK